MTAADTVKDLHVDVKRCPDCGARFGIDAAFCPFDGVPLSAATWDPTRDPLAGTVIDGRYEVLEPLGEGGMGTVYRVRHVTLDRTFAMKALRRDLATDADLAARFMQEARATAAIKHPAVVAITDFGELEDGVPYFVMELLAGETLATRIRARGPLAPAQAIKVARKVAEGLEASHAAGVVHRDLKPENVFLVGKSLGKEPEDEVRLVDFGAAKVVGASKLTRPGIVFGTPYYMSPEQASGGVVDARADVYSLGVLLYEMLTGTVPFEADTYMGVLTKHMYAAPDKPSERVPSGVRVPEELEAVVLRALEKEPSSRYRSMAEVIKALDDVSARQPGAASSAPMRERQKIPVAFSQMSTADRIQLSVTKRIAEEARRKRRMFLVGVAAAAASVAGGIALLRVRAGEGEAGGASGALATAALGASVAPAPSPGAASAAPVEVEAEPSATATPVASAAGAATVESPPASASAQASRPPAPRPKPPAAASTATASAASVRPAPTRPKSGPDDFVDPWHK